MLVNGSHIDSDNQDEDDDDVVVALLVYWKHYW